MRKKSMNSGFTLVELIVVIVLISTLIGVTIGGVFTYIQQARLNTDINNADTIQKMVGTKISTSSWSMRFNKAAQRYDIVWFWKDERVKADLNNDDDSPLNYEQGFADGFKKSPNGSVFNSTFEGSSMDRQINEILGGVDGKLLESKSGNYYMLRVYCNDGVTAHVECHIVSEASRYKLTPPAGRRLPDNYDFTKCFGLSAEDYIDLEY